jgi:VWFA-related protein
MESTIRNYMASIFAALLMCSTSVWAQGPPGKMQTSGQVRIPSRPPASLFKGKQGKQKTEIHFDPGTSTVTIKLLVQDPNGYFIPNLRKENFVVYENGVRQQNATVEVEHAPVTLGLLMEFGGRIQGLNQRLGEEVSRAGQRLVDELGREDRLAIWKYSDKVEKITDYSQDHLTLETSFLNLGTPEISETNLYDTIIFAVGQMRPVTGRKGIVLISSGIDTSSKGSYEDAIRTAQESDSPIYVISLGPIMRQLVEMRDHAPVARIDWEKTENELQEIARVSGGRTYAPTDTIDLSPIYDDLMENLKVRYVVTYKSSRDLDPKSPRAVRVELVDPETGGPLQILDSNGKTIRSRVIAQDSYVPNAASDSDVVH